MRLLESKTRQERAVSRRALFSIIWHVSIISWPFSPPPARAREGGKAQGRKVSFIEPKKNEPPPRRRGGAEARTPEAQKAAPEPPKVVVPRVATPAPPQGFKVVPPPVNIPTSLPAIDLSKAITNEADFSGKGVAGGSAGGVKGGTGKEGDTGKEAGEKQGPYFEFQVEKPVEKIGGDNPDYPSHLRDQGVTGQVLAQFVVGENGRYEGGKLKTSISNPGATAAVKVAPVEISAAKLGEKVAHS